MSSTVRASCENEPFTPHDTGGEITVLYVDDNPDYLDLVERYFDEEPRLELRRETSPVDATGRLDGVDCVVSDYAMPEQDGIELLEAVRAVDPMLPFVLFTCVSREEVTEPLLSEEWTDYLQKQGGSATMALLSRRIRRLVDHRRTSTRARRVLSAVELSREGTAITAPDGTFDVVNHAFLTRFGYDRRSLLGRSWTGVFTAEEVERLRSTALPTTKEGWRWTGRCDGLRANGDAFTVSTAIARLDDGALAFTVREE